MEKIKTYFGLFWFANEPDSRFQAVLNVKGDEASLCYFGKFQPFPMHLSRDVSNIFGLATDLENHNDYSFKLYSLFESKKSTGTLSKIILTTKLFLIGKPNRIENSSQYSSLKLNSYSWKFWLNQSGFSTNLTPMQSKTFAYEIKYDRPGEIALYKSDVLAIQIIFQAGLSNTPDGQKLLKEDPTLTVNFTNHMDLPEILRYRQVIERFFMILWEEEHFFTKTEVVSSDKTVFEVIDKRRSLGNRSRCAISSTEIVLNFDRWFTSWLSISTKYDYPIKTFFFALTGYTMDIHSEFLNFTFGLERLFKQMFGSSMKLSKGISALVSRLDSEAQKKFKLLDLIGIEKTRHYLVHLDEKHKPDVIPAEQLPAINDKLIELMFKLLKTEIIR